MDKNYRMRYGASPVKNFKRAELMGICGLLEIQLEETACSKCGYTIPLQSDTCPKCEKTKK